MEDDLQSDELLEEEDELCIQFPFVLLRLLVTDEETVID